LPDKVALFSSKYISKPEGGICHALLLYSIFTELWHTSGLLQCSTCSQILYNICQQLMRSRCLCGYHWQVCRYALLGHNDVTWHWDV